MKCIRTLLYLLLLCTALPAAAQTNATRVYDASSIENRVLTYRDARLLNMRHTNTHFAMPVYPDRRSWEERAAELRTHILVSAGLWPRPEKTPLNARIFGRVEGDGYTVEKVYFESLPGFFLAGNLYRPRGQEGPHPGILSPHGHWSRGRLHDTEQSSVPARAINLARQGHVVFAYDMVGYGDTRQVDHTFAADSLSQLWGISLLGLQLRNSIRALDFISALPDVDADRLGITGASGGATQAFLLTAVDDAERIDVTAPVNMLSAYMQGGDLCENAPGLRLNTFNVEIGALAAPRPQLMISNTQDWTAHTPLEEHPMMQSIYRLYDADERLGFAHFDYPHNYNRAAREVVYPWFGRWLLRSDERPVQFAERPAAVDPEELLVFLNEPVEDRERTFADLPEDGYTAPPKEMNAQGLKQYLRKEARAQLDASWPREPGDVDAFRALYETALHHVVAASIPEGVTARKRGGVQTDSFVAETYVLSRKGRKDGIPAVWYDAGGDAREATIVLAPEGKQAVSSPDGELEPWVRHLLESGRSVLAVDPFKVGEHVLPEGAETDRDEAAPFFTTFNRTDVQERVQDVLTSLAFLESRSDVERVSLTASGAAVPEALLAAAVAEGRFERVALRELDVDIGSSAQALEAYFLPGLLRIGGLSTAAALVAPTPLWLDAQAGFDGDAIGDVYALSGAGENLQLKQEEEAGDWVEWLLRR